MAFRILCGTMLAAILCAPPVTWGQAHTPVTIVVKDPSGTAIPGAYIRISPGTPAGDHLVTDEQGRIAIGLSPGEYQLQVTAQGFSPATQDVVIPAKPETIPVTLQLGASAGELAVDADPGSGAGSAAATSESAEVLVVTGAPGQRAVFTPRSLREYPQTTITVFDHHANQKETYGGVPLIDLLAKLGVPHGKDLMGKVLADYVVATGSDGYKSVIALGEVDPAFHPGVVLVADTLDGKPLDAKTGPFRLVVSQDKRPARSVRNLVTIEVKTAE